MDQNGIFMTYIVLKLTDGLQKRLAFNISDGSAYLYNSDPVLILLFGPIEPALDLVCNMRNDLYGTSAVIPMTFLLKNRPVNFTGGHVGIFVQALINKPFIMTEIQICLRTVIRYENLSMLDRVHRTRVYIDIGIKLLHGHLISPGLQKTSQGGRRDPFAQTGNHTACHKYIFYCHHIFLLACCNEKRCQKAPFRNLLTPSSSNFMGLTISHFAPFVNPCFFKFFVTVQIVRLKKI